MLWRNRRELNLNKFTHELDRPNVAEHWSERLILIDLRPHQNGPQNVAFSGISRLVRANIAAISECLGESVK